MSGADTVLIWLTVLLMVAAPATVAWAYRGVKRDPLDEHYRDVGRDP